MYPQARQARLVASVLPSVFDLRERLQRAWVRQQVRAGPEPGYAPDHFDGLLRQRNVAGLSRLRCWDQPGTTFQIDVPPFRVQQLRHARAGQQQQRHDVFQLLVPGFRDGRLQPLRFGGVQITLAGVVYGWTFDTAGRVAGRARYVPFDRKLKRSTEDDTDFLDSRGSQPFGAFRRKSLRDVWLVNFRQTQLAPLTARPRDCWEGGAMHHRRSKSDSHSRWPKRKRLSYGHAP